MDANYGFLNQSMMEILTRIEGLGRSFDASLQPVYFAAGVATLVMACIKLLSSRDMNAFAEFVVKYAQLMVIILLSSQWMPLTEGYVAQMGSWGAGASGFDVRQVAPSTVIFKALAVAGKMYTENLSWMRLFLGSTQDNIAHLLLLLGCLGTILLAILMAAMLMLFFVVFKLASAISLAFLIFFLFGATRFMSAPGVSRILAYGVQMLVLSVIVGCFFVTLDKLDLSGHLRVDQSITVLVVFFFFGLLFKHAVNIAREQISGMPSMDLHDIGRMGANATSALLKAAAVPALGALGTLGGIKMAGRGASGLPGAGGSGGGSSGGGGGSQAQLNAPRAAMRMMLDSPMKEAQWTEGRDLPKSATRMLYGRHGLPDHTIKEAEWTEAKDLPPSSTKQLPAPKN